MPLFLLGAVLFGCQQNSLSPQAQPVQASMAMGEPDRPPPTPQQVALMLEPNVLGVSCFYDPINPWLWNTEHTVVRGIKINALYLRGPNYTGVFGNGVIRPKLLVSSRDEQGKIQYKLVKEWSFDVNQAMPFRAKKRMKAGWGYALFLNWGDMDLTGRSLRLIVNFERADGIIISGSKKDFRVPKSNDT
jgi:hypothetical protein